MVNFKILWSLQMNYLIQAMPSNRSEIPYVNNLIIIRQNNWYILLAEYGITIYRRVKLR